MEVAVPARAAREEFDWIEDTFRFIHDGSLSRNEQLYWFEFMARVRKSADAAFTKLAGDIADSRVFENQQFLKPDVFVAFHGGMPPSDGHRYIDTAKRLKSQPQLAEEFAAGLVSFDQVEMVAEGAELDPSAANMLMDHARNDSFESLRRQFNKVRAAAASPKDHEEAAKKVFLRQPGGDQFGKGLSGYLLNEQSAILNAVLDPLTNRICKERLADGAFVSREHCRGLALVEMAKLAAGGSSTKGPRPHVTLVASLEVLRQESMAWNQYCEVPGVGPVTADRLRKILTDAYISVSIVDWPSDAPEKYRPSAALKRRLDVDGDICNLLGCDLPGVEVDHNEEARDGGETTYENLQKICAPHHRYKTKYRLKLVGPRGRRRMVKLSPAEMYGGERAGPGDRSA